MNLKIKLIFLILLNVFVLPSNANARELEANVFILVDFSGSYYTEDRIKNEIPDNLNELTYALISKNGPNKPALIQVLPITTFSQASRPMCEYKFIRKPLLGSSKQGCGSTPDEFCSHKKREFKDYLLNDCKELITAEKIDQNVLTDISGALALTGQIAKSQPADDNYLIIMSDMFEYRIDELPVSKIDLTNFKVFVVCGGDYNNEDNVTKLCMDSEESWSRKFKDLGASNIIFAIETGNWGDGAMKELF